MAATILTSKHIPAGDASNERFVWVTEHMVKLGRMENAKVLDIGCGFGWNALAVSLLANADVVANDIRPEMTSVVEAQIAQIRKLGAPASVSTLTGDICSIKLPSNCFDAIMCQQTLEHVHDLEALFEMCFRVLRPGGKAVFTNDNNILNRKSFDEIQKMWWQRDTDPDFIEQLKRERPIENRDIQPYAAMRREIILRANPRLTEPDVSEIVAATAGKTDMEIIRLATYYTPGQSLPTRPRSSWCRNPVTGEYCERQLDPYEIADQLSAAGFTAKVRHGFRKRRPLRWLNAIQWRPLNTLLFQKRPFFVVVATKEATA